MPRTDIDWASLGFGFSDVNCHIRAVWKDGKWGELDFVKEGLNEGFKFNNPNVRGECGCGESFNV